MTETESHTIRLLQDIRSEMRERFEGLEASVADVHAETVKMRADVLATKAIGRELAIRLTVIEKHLGLVKA